MILRLSILMLLLSFGGVAFAESIKGPEVGSSWTVPWSNDVLPLSCTSGQWTLHENYFVGQRYRAHYVRCGAGAYIAARQIGRYLIPCGPHTEFTLPIIYSGVSNQNSYLCSQINAVNFGVFVCKGEWSHKFFSGARTASGKKIRRSSSREDESKLAILGPAGRLLTAVDIYNRLSSLNARPQKNNEFYFCNVHVDN